MPPRELLLFPISPWVTAIGVHISAIKGMVIDSVEFCEYTQNTFHTVIWVLYCSSIIPVHGKSNIIYLNCYRKKKFPLCHFKAEIPAHFLSSLATKGLELTINH